MHFIMTNGLLMILSSVMPAVPTDDDSYPLSGPLNADSYKTVDMNYRLRQNTKKREVPLTLNAEGSVDKSQNNAEGCFKRDVGEAYTNKDGVWIFPLTVPGGSHFVNLSYVVYSLAGKPFPVRSWCLNDSTLSIIVKQGDMVRLTASFNSGSYEISEDNKKRLVLKHNISSKAVSLIFDKVDDDDEGGYKIEENCTKIDGRTQVRKEMYHLYLLKPDDVKRSNVGENIIILRLNKITSSSSYLYHYDQVFTVLKDTECDVNSTSYFNGRLKCGMDKGNNRYQIEIQNVVRSDSGLYRVVRDGYDTDRCFLNITDIGSGGVPVFVTLYVVGAVCVISAINLIGWVIWCKRRKVHITKEVRRIQHEQWKPDLYLTPTAFGTPLPTATTETRNTDHSNSTHITMSIHMAQMVLMDVHDVVDISNDFDPEYTQEQEEIINVSTKNRTSPCSDVGGYLTVLAERDIAV